MNEILYCFVIFSITLITILGIVAIFCYKHDNMKMLLKGSTTLKKGEVSTDFEVDIDKQKRN